MTGNKQGKQNKPDKQFLESPKFVRFGKSVGPFHMQIVEIDM